MLTINPDTLVFVNEEGVLQNSKVKTDEDGNEKEIKNDIETLTLNGLLQVKEIITDKIQAKNIVVESNVMETTDKGESLNASTVGTATIPAGQTQIEVNTTAITQKDRVFVTTKTTTDKNVSVTQIEDNQEFIASILESVDYDIIFDWFIIGSN
jgi:hypothetical protein